MAWKDKPKADRFGDIGSLVGIILAVIVVQTMLGGAEFWQRLICYVVGISLGRIIGTEIGKRSA